MACSGCPHFLGDRHRRSLLDEGTRLVCGIDTTKGLDFRSKEVRRCGGYAIRKTGVFEMTAIRLGGVPPSRSSERSVNPTRT
jgi:hypothetical protein